MLNIQRRLKLAGCPIGWDDPDKYLNRRTLVDIHDDQKKDHVIDQILNTCMPYVRECVILTQCTNPQTDALREELSFNTNFSSATLAKIMNKQEVITRKMSVLHDMSVLRRMCEFIGFDTETKEIEKIQALLDSQIAEFARLRWASGDDESAHIARRNKAICSEIAQEKTRQVYLRMIWQARHSLAETKDTEYCNVLEAIQVPERHKNLLLLIDFGSYQRNSWLALKENILQLMHMGHHIGITVIIIVDANQVSPEVRKLMHNVVIGSMVHYPPIIASTLSRAAVWKI